MAVEPPSVSAFASQSCFSERFSFLVRKFLLLSKNTLRRPLQQSFGFGTLGLSSVLGKGSPDFSDCREYQVSFRCIHGGRKFQAREGKRSTS